MPESSRPELTYSLATAPRSASRTATAAIAIFDLLGDPAGLASILGIDTLPSPGSMKLIHIAGLDHALLCRVDTHHTQIHTHAGPYVISRLCEFLETSGVPAASPVESGPTDPLEYWLAAAPSPLAVDVLLAQPRFRRLGITLRADPRLNRLLRPPLVVAVGRPNAGKSSLLNALARRSVAVVSDQPGTTRDSVGAMLELDGLVVRWLDLPGIRDTEDPIEAQAIRLATDWASKADLVLHCDPGCAPAPIGGIRADLSVRTMADRDPNGSHTGLACSAHTGEGLAELARAVRETLLQDDILSAEAIWDLPDASDRPIEGRA